MGRLIVVASISRLDYVINQYGISKLLAFYFTPLGHNCNGGVQVVAKVWS